MMNDSDGHTELETLPKLTPKQQRFADLLIAGVNNSDAYRRAYNTQNMAPATIQREAHARANHPKIATTLATARAFTRHETHIHAQDLVAKLQEIADAPVQKPVRASDAIAAIDKIAKIAGLYKDTGDSRGPIQISRVIINLDQGNGEYCTETRELVDGTWRMLEPSNDEPSR